jgi:hypothetical protein
MHLFYKKSILFWFILLILALFNAALRELTYKPLLSPYIGAWAHQISSIIAIGLFFFAIYIFLRRNFNLYKQKQLIRVGFIWMLMTFIFEVGMNLWVRNLSLAEIMKTYYFWQGEMWIFVLISLLFLPIAANKLLLRRT